MILRDGMECTSLRAERKIPYLGDCGGVKKAVPLYVNLEREKFIN